MHSEFGLPVVAPSDVDVVVAVEHGGVLVPDEFGGELERLEFDVLFVDVAVDAVAVVVVEFAARSRPPVFCCCSRCNLKLRFAEIWSDEFSL